MSRPERVTIYEVGPRDGLQNLPDTIPAKLQAAEKTRTAQPQ